MSLETATVSSTVNFPAEHPRLAGLLLAVVGVGCGLAGAALMTRAMTTLLFGVSALDPLTYAAVAIALGGTAVLASYLPARRASRVDPAIALRGQE